MPLSEPLLPAKPLDVYQRLSGFPTVGVVRHRGEAAGVKSPHSTFLRLSEVRSKIPFALIRVIRGHRPYAVGSV